MDFRKSQPGPDFAVASHVAKLKVQNIYGFLKSVSERYGDKPALFGRHHSVQGNEWYSLSFTDICQRAEKLAGKLLSLGLSKGDRVLILAKSCPEFAVGFFAIPLAGGVIVPVDIRLNLVDQKFISEFSEAKFILYVGQDMADLAGKIASQSQMAPKILNINDSILEKLSLVPHLEDKVLQVDETFLMAFTSGTTSQPKAVMLTFGNILFQLIDIADLFRGKSDYQMLSILPLHHMFEITCGFLLPFGEGGRVYYANSLIPHQIISFFQQHKIRNLLVVPLFLKTLKKGIECEVSSNPLKKAWFNITYKLASKIPWQPLRRALFYPLHKKFGGELRQIISGASALDQKIAVFFHTLGIGVYEGYGLTETAPIISCNSPKENKPGTIGKPLPGLELRLHPETQEIQVRGPNVMKGYFKNLEATRACLSEDGWFNTGDVGAFDSEGYLTIQGRNKDLIVLGNGKKVVPEEVEEKFRDLPDIQEVCVLGIDEAVTAVIVLEKDKVSEQAQIQKVLHQATLQLSYYKRPTKFIFLTEPLPKTTTLKIKKNLVKEILIQQRTTI